MLTIRRAKVFDGTRTLGGLHRLELDAAGRLGRLEREESPEGAVPPSSAAARGGEHATTARPGPASPVILVGGSLTTTIDAGGALVTPGLVDGHTHVVWGGTREAEFALRLAGASYADILAAGGGIHSTVAATNAATDEELLAAAEARLHAMLRHGVTTVEIKSGYGLEPAAELRLLRLIDRLRARTPQRLVATFLAHTIPPARADVASGARAAYVTELSRELIPRLAAERLAEAVDVFCERGAFSLDETRQLFAAARDARLAIHVHAEQLSHTGSARLAAEFGALSADHLEHLDDAGIGSMAAAGTVAVLLPGAELTLATASPPVAALRAAGVPLAVATDCNPGSSHTTNLPLMAWLACLRYRLAPEEALGAIIARAAQALGEPADASFADRVARHGLVVWRATSPEAFFYQFAAAPDAATPTHVLLPAPTSPA